MENRKKSEFVLYYLRETDREGVNSMSGIRTAREEEFERVFSLMERSFPPDEYRGYDGQRALLREPDFVNRMREEERARCDCRHSNYCIARMYTLDMACHQRLQEPLPKDLQREIDQLEKKG